MTEAAPIDVRVRAIRWECDRVLRLTLEPLRGALPPAEPGAHVDVHLPGGLVRPYSLTVGSSPRGYVIGVLREASGRGASAAVHDAVRPGDVLRISAPRNHFALDAGDDPAWLLGGGIGITPLLAMAERLAVTTRAWSMLACVRSRALLPFAEEVARLGVAVRADDESGVPDLAALVARAPAHAHLYCCGPSSMLDAFLAAAAGRDPARVHIERFTPAAPEPGDGEFVVQLARRGLTLVVPADKTILDAVLEAGVDAVHSCRTGVCGTCETRVLDGEPEHRDLILTDEERAAGSMMICCSRSRTPRLVLDL